MEHGNALTHADSIAFLAVQAVVVFVAVYSFVRQTWNRLFRKGIRAEVIRGKESWQKFFLIHGLLLLLLFQLVAVAEITEGYRIFGCLFNFALAAYLTLFNGWFRNRSLGWINKMQKKPEK